MNAVASRSRRSVLAVPASNPRFIEKARGLAVDAFFLDLEDAVAPSEKERAREAAVAALNEGGWDGKVRTVRINDATTAWAYRDVITVVEGAGAALDCLVLPKVTGPAPSCGWTRCSLRSNAQSAWKWGGSGSKRRSKTRAD